MASFRLRRVLCRSAARASRAWRRGLRRRGHDRAPATFAGAPPRAPARRGTALWISLTRCRRSAASRDDDRLIDGLVRLVPAVVVRRHGDGGVARSASRASLPPAGWSCRRRRCNCGRGAIRRASRTAGPPWRVPPSRTDRPSSRPAVIARGASPQPGRRTSCHAALAEEGVSARWRVRSNWSITTKSPAVLAHRAHGRDRDDARDAQALQAPDVRAEVDLARPMRWPRPWRGREDHAHACQHAGDEGVAGRAEGRGSTSRLEKAVDLA